MKYKILAVVLGLGALGYLFRNQIVQKIDHLGWWLDGMIEDLTPDEEPHEGPLYATSKEDK